ncbi:uncharacterized protein LOC118432371 [Branchiostoma floridae]|uniref:Uncharacterized protein LOC118432371 n=1 Tax=Branchiostoma floridae TaxID=7739 RepID=A0A9J7MHU1_BRAFL|nr:uncharacterized protein LOC118432371 [Branchiostoma floridae]
MAADEDEGMSLTKNMEMVPLRPRKPAGEDEVLPCPMQVAIYGKQDRCQRTMKSAYVHVQKCGGFGIKLFFHEIAGRISQWLPRFSQDKVRREILEHARCGANCCGRLHNQASYECKVSLDNLNSIMACRETVVLSFQEWGQLKDIFFTGKKSSKRLEQLLKSWLSEKPWESHQFEVDIPPDQCLSHGKAVLCIYPRWLVLSKVYSEKELKEKVACQNLPEEEEEEEMEVDSIEDVHAHVEAKLPFRVPLVDLRTFGPNHGTGFYLKDVNDRQYFLRCEKGEDINTQIDEYRDDLFQQLADKFQTASNVDQATISQVLQRDGFLLNVGVFAEKPQPGKDWCVYVFMTHQKTDLEALVESKNLQLVCPPRPVAISTDMRCPKLEGNKGYKVENPGADEQLQLCYEALMEERRGPADAPNMSSYKIKVSPMRSSRGSYVNSTFHGNMCFQAGAKPVFSFTADFSRQNESLGEEGYPLTVRKSPLNPSWLKRRERLVEMLSCKMPFNNNWEMLVEKIGLDYTALLEVAFRLNVAVFADNPSVGGLWTVMIAISGNKDLKMLNKVVKGYVVCPARSIAVGQGEDMNLVINIKSQGWSLKDTPRTVVLPHERLRILTDNQDFVCHKEVTILHEESNKYQFQAQIVASLGKRDITFSVHGDFKLYEDNSTNGEPIYELHSPKAKSKWLPVSKRLKLCQMLDWNLPLGNNWKMMVEKIGLDFQALKQIEEVSYREGRSPTELLLQDWEARQPTHFTQDNLYRILRQLERKDVITDCGLRLSSSSDNPLTHSSQAFDESLKPENNHF